MKVKCYDPFWRQQHGIFLQKLRTTTACLCAKIGTHDLEDTKRQAGVRFYIHMNVATIQHNITFKMNKATCFHCIFVSEHKARTPFINKSILNTFRYIFMSCLRSFEGSIQNTRNTASLDWMVSVKRARREFTAELKEKCDALELKAQLQPVLTCSATGSKNNRTQPAIHRSAGPVHDPNRCTWRPRTYELQTGESLDCVYL